MNQPSSFLSQPGRQGAFFPTSLPTISQGLIIKMRVY